MPLTRLDNLLSSKTGKYIYVCPDDFNASDALDNRGNSQLRPFVSIQRAFLEVARFSYVPGVNNDRFDQFTIMLSPGPHFIDNRPGDIDTAEIPVFNYDSATDAWNDPAIFDLGNPNNILYKFNGRDGGTTIPRGTSLVGADLRRTVVRPLYVPDPVDTDVPRTSLFNVTGGCYFWQFTIKDAEDVNGPLLGQAYTQPRSTQKSYPLFSHHKITNFVYADREDLGLLYRKISKCFSKYQEAIDDVYTAESDRIQDTWSSTFSYAVNGTVVFGGEAYKAIQASTNKRPDLEDTYWERLSTISREFDFRVQENRIVGPVADTIELAEFVLTEPSAGLVNVTVTSKINHGFFPGQYVAITNTGINNNLNGVFQVYTISTTNPKEFTYRVLTSASALGQIPGATIIPDPNATVQAEIDSVESASPYVFNVSIRSVWGICGIWADGRKATGFKSMVIAQYTGVSLQKDDRAFIRYDEFSNTWNQASLNDAFATIPYHIKGDAYWKDDWRNFHVKASDDSFIQNVSIFAVGFADHFLLESGGDMSITNSNSNFGNTSMHSKGFKGFAFNQDKGGYITDIVPPKSLEADAQPIKTSYYPVDVQLSKPLTNSNRLYLTGDKANNFLSRPAATINKYRIGARSYIDDTKCEKLYVNVTADQSAGETGATVKSAVVSPQGFKRWSASLTTVSPVNLGVGDVNEDGTPNTAADTLAYNLRQDGANLIDANKIFIQAEGFGYILEKYPYLQSIPYNNPNITSETGRYRDARNLILSNRQEIVDTAYSQMLAYFPGFTPPGVGGADKCKRDIGLIVDAVAADLYDGGNVNIIEATKTYFDVNGTLIVNGLVGETTQSIYAFDRAKDLSILAITNQLTIKDLTIIADPATGSNTSTSSCANVRSSITTLFLILKTALTTALTNASATPPIVAPVALPLTEIGPWSTVSESSKCRRDIGLLVEAVTADLRLGGNENIVNAAESYFTGTGQLNLSGTIASNGVVTGLTSTANLLAGMAVTRTSGAGSFGVNPTILTINSATQITVTQVSGTVTAGAISFIANQLDYIEKERIETLDAFDYVRNLAISAMRNHNTYLSGTSTSGSPIITVSSTNGLVLGMSVRSVATIPTIPGSEQLVNDRLVPINYTINIPNTAYIKKIGNGSNGLAVNEIQLGAKGSKFDSGVTINANASGPINFFFQLEQGIWTNAIKPSVDPNVIQDYNYTVTNGECASVVENINTYFTAFNTVINNGIGTVAKKVSTINTGSFARRTTLFTLTDTSSGAAPTDPHHLETGTPVRLVPRVKAGAVVDKRLIRLPKGFDTNTVYYVIAPGRKTDPEDYSNITRFDGVTAGSFQNLMLASSIENAATGIYIYSSETENVDPNVIIDVYQYVLDLSYNLNQYVTKRGDGTTFVTEEPHLFDKPNSSWNINDNQKYQAIFFKPIGNGSLPNGILPNQEYFARYINKITLALNCQFEVYDTIVEAIAGANPKNFAAFGGSFYVFSNKKRSPLRFAPEAGNLGGTWYLGTDASKPNTILERIRKTDFVSKDKTPDTWFERISDNRKKEDRVYRLRYVVPKYLKSVREPLRGFIIKSRNDQTRRLLPQKLLIKPTAAGSSIADLSIPNISAAITGKSANREFLGYSNSQHGPLFQSVYDPYNPESISSIDLTPKFRRKVTTDSKITFYIQSAKTVSVGGTNYLEITVFDLGIEEQGYKEKLFTTVKIDVPQGGTGIFVSNTANLPSSDTSNIVTWGGAYKGKGRVHKYFNYENQNYMILKDITFVSTLDYDPTVPTIFTQGSVSAALTAAPNGGRSNIDNYLYATEGANVYTMTPGDTFQAENGNYTIASVTDVDDFENTFYIFDINTIRRRIFGQQDGIYYLTCLRGDIAPFPTGAGVGNNFRDYKFSQPVSKLYPQFYRNDPEWYKQLDSAAIDPPASISAADNYIHGLVTVNDAKSSVTKEGVIDLIKDRGTKRFTFTGNNKIQSQLGGASAGSEARRIPISGDSPYATEGRLYVELRRPSIARSGNHTFEYLGFGPGNYSTGFPARQEVILTDIQDFYAQAKRQNGGIVFYTGLNSNGDLYIGNRKINAITGEETFLESAQLLESEDDNDEIGNFVTTFDGPVTFNDIVTFAAVLPKTNIFTSPIEMDVATVIPGSGLTAPPAFKIKSNINGAIDDSSLRTNPITSRDTGDIVLTDNRLKVAVIDFNNRGLQDYSVRTAIYQTTPDQLDTFGVQSVSFGTKYPLNTGDILLKGGQVGTTGSVAWIYANNFTILTSDKKFQIQGFGTGINKARIIWPVGSNGIQLTNASLGLNVNSQIKIVGTFNKPENISGLTSTVLGAWNILASTFNEINNFVDIITNSAVPTGIYDISDGPLGGPLGEPGITISASNVAWKEVGIIGAESIRTQTDDIGDYKVGINTVARASHAAYLNAFVESGSTDPRANLDIVGTTFISGKTLATNNFKDNSVLSQRTFNAQDNAFLVGGDSATPNNLATLRLSTTSNRLGINTTNAQLNGTADGGLYNSALSVIGNSVISGNITNLGNLTIGLDLAVNGGDITTTATSFNLVNQVNTTILNLGGYSRNVNLFNNNTVAQSISIGNTSSSQNLFIGNAALKTELFIHTNSKDAVVKIATVNDDSASLCNIEIGGAYSNTNSKTSIGTRNTLLAGDLIIGINSSISSISTPSDTIDIFKTSRVVNFGTASSILSIGSVGGFTTVNNSLRVLASANVEGNIRLNGGLNAGNIEISRARFGTAAAVHGLGSNLNQNIDFYKYQATGRVIDTQGVALWGSTNFLISGGQVATFVEETNNNPLTRTASTYSFIATTTPGAGAGATFTITVNNDATKTLTITNNNPGTGYLINDILTIPNSSIGSNAGGNLTIRVLTVNSVGTNYNLPISTPSQFDFAPGDLIFLDRADPLSPAPRNEAFSEILKVVGLTNLTDPSDPKGFRIEVQRAQDGTTLRSDHPDGCVIVKFIKQPKASYIASPANGIGATTGNVTIGVAEFGGILTTNDYLRLSEKEFAKVVTLISTDPQALIINDGGSPAATTFKVDSTTGNTSILGNLGVGSGFNRFTVAASTGDTTVAGTLTTEGTLTINGSSSITTQFFRITNGASPAITTFLIDTATGSIITNGSITSNGGDMTFFGVDGTTPRLTFVNSSGDFATYGSFSAYGTGTSKFGGGIQIGGAFGSTTFPLPNVNADLTINGGDLIINSGATEIFKVSNNGSLKVAGINNYISRTGGREWVYRSAGNITGAANKNYFIAVSANTLFLLPQNALMGDMIRIIDTSGNMSYNVSLVVRAPAGIKVQNTIDNTGQIMLGSGFTIPSTYTTGGELVVQTPYASFGLVYAGDLLPDGTQSGIANTQIGWYLLEV